MKKGLVKALIVEVILILIISIYSIPISAANTDVRLNSLGFQPSYNKYASIDMTCTNFYVVTVPAGVTVYTGTVGNAINATDSGETVRVADFSSLTTEGTYSVNVPGVGNSETFSINKTVYNNAYFMAMKAFYLARCGTAVSYTYPADGNTYSHAACHVGEDAYLNYVGGPDGETKTSTMGWHDAGDYNKYVVNAAISVGMMFMAWEQFQNLIDQIPLNLPVTASGYPEFLEEIKWETDWLLTMQVANGGVYDKVSETGFCGFIMPEDDTTDSYFWGYNNIGTVETATFCAAMAMGARIFAPYDSAYSTQCLNAASSAYSYLTNNATNTTANLTGCSTGNYSTSDANEGRLWAAAEMWQTTGNSTILSDFETRANSYSPTYVDVDFDWSNDKNLGMYTYTLSTRTGRNATLLTNIENNIISDANSITTTAANHAYGRPLGTSYYWGCNGGNARTAMMLQIANQLSPNTNYINGVLDAIAYLYGRNTHDRSYVTGLGINPPMNPQHRPSAADGITNPWPGYLVGGSPGTNQDDPVLTLTPTGLPPADYWTDQQGSYSSNEVAINWQGALVYALAGCINFDITNTVTVSPTMTKTIAPSFTMTPTISSTGTKTSTYTATPTITATSTYTGTNTSSQTVTLTQTQTYTQTPSFSPTVTGTSTRTLTLTDTNTASQTYTNTSTITPTSTATATVTQSKTDTFTFSPTITNTFTSTQTFTQTSTWTPTASASTSSTTTTTNTKTATQTYTPTDTFTITSTYTGSPSPTLTNTSTLTQTTTLTITFTNTPTFSLTSTLTGTDTATGTLTPTFVITQTYTKTNSPTFTPTFTFTNSPVVSATPTYTNIIFTWTITQTYTISPTNTSTPTATGTSSNTITLTASLTYTRTNTLTPTGTSTETISSTATVTLTNTESFSPTDTQSSTTTYTETATLTVSASPTSTITQTITLTVTPSATQTQSQTLTITPTTTNTYSPIVSPTPTNTNIIFTWTITPTITVSETQTITPTDTESNTETPLETSTITETSSPLETTTVTETMTVIFTSSPQDTPTSTATATGITNPTTTQTTLISVTNTQTVTSTVTAIISNTFTVTPSITITLTNTVQPSVTSSNSVNPTNTETAALSATPTNTQIIIPTASSTPQPVASTTQTPEGPKLPKPYPNPINPYKDQYLKIAYDLDKDADLVTVKIYTVAFRLAMKYTFNKNEIQTILLQGIECPTDQMKDLSNGAYYYVIITSVDGKESRSAVDKLIIIK